MLQALVIETAEATEQVDLIGGETYAGFEVAKGAVTANVDSVPLNKICIRRLVASSMNTNAVHAGPRSSNQ